MSDHILKIKDYLDIVNNKDKLTEWINNFNTYIINGDTITLDFSKVFNMSDEQIKIFVNNITECKEIDHITKYIKFVNIESQITHRKIIVRILKVYDEQKEKDINNLANNATIK
jgi:hypothetical protein